MPGALAWNLVALAEARARGERTGKFCQQQGFDAGEYRPHLGGLPQCKTIYQIEPALANCLARSPWPAETPTEALRVPTVCPVLCIPREDGHINHVAATLDLLTGAEASGASEMRLSMLTVDGDLWIPIALLHLTGPTLSECIDAAAAEATAHGAPKRIANVWRNDLSGLALTIFLYIAGEPDLVRLAHPGAKPLKAKIARTDPDRYRDLSEPTVHAVGKAFVRAIEHWEIEHRGDEGVTTGRIVRPHMRRAIRTYTGPVRGEHSRE